MQEFFRLKIYNPPRRILILLVNYKVNLENKKFFGICKILKVTMPKKTRLRMRILITQKNC